jgi:hypothetical protein
MRKRKEPTIDEVMEEFGLAARWEELGGILGEDGRYWVLSQFLCAIQNWERSEAEGRKIAWEKAVSLMEQGYTAEQLKQMGPRGAPPRVNS